MLLIATGSEVALALDVAGALEDRGIGADVVSLPCWDRFEAQDRDYQDQVLPDGVLRVSIEAGTTFGWERLTGRDGLRIGIDRFGASAPADDLFRHFGFIPEAIVEKITGALNR